MHRDEPRTHTHTPAIPQRDREALRRVLGRSGGRLTGERVAILQAVCDAEGHFLPEDILAILRERGHGVSLTTIYRNLPLLVEAGIIRRACLNDERDGAGTRYEHVSGHDHHDHLVCSRCGRKVEFTYPAIDVLQEAVAASHGFRLEGHLLELIGVCPACQEAEARNSAEGKADGAGQG